MEVLSFDQAREIWQRIVKLSPDTTFSFELEVNKRLLNLFHVGVHYYYIFNCATAEFEFLDEKAEDILGYKADELSPQFLFTKLHPDDVSYFLNFEDTITKFYEDLPYDKLLKYKSSYDIRIQKADGEYCRMLQQVTVIQVGEEGSVFRTLGVHTDITHLKPEGKPILNFIGLCGDPSYYNVQSTVSFDTDQPLLTKREAEVVKLLVEGCSSQQIAEQLFISLHTVKTHRRNIMAKTQANSSTELARIAIANGWV